MTIRACLASDAAASRTLRGSMRLDRSRADLAAQLRSESFEWGNAVRASGLMLKN
jgi:hypothetical protein